MPSAATSGDAGFARGMLDVVLAGQPGTGVCALDVDGRVAWWHASAARLLGHDARTMTGRSLDTLGPEERRQENPVARALFEAGAADGSRLEMALLMRHGERRVVCLSIHPQRDDADDVRGFLVVMQAVQQGEARRSVSPMNDDRAAAHRLNLSFVSGEPAWIGLDLFADITHVSATGAERLGCTAERLLGSPLARHLRAVDGATWPVLMHRALRNRDRAVIALVAPEVEATGAEPMRAQLMPLFGGERQIQGFTLLIHAAPARVSAVERRRAPAAERQSSDDAWLMAAAHDLREPLRKIQQSVDQLHTAEAPRLSGPGREQVVHLVDTSRRMQDMIGGLLRLARVDVEPAEDGDIDLPALVREVCADLAALIDESGAQVHIGALGMIRGDVPQLRSLFQNLIDNSIRYRRADTAPDIRIERIGDAESGEECVIDYIDNAAGIKAPELVFSPLRRPSAQVDGTGIGLSLCRRICRRHRGDLVIRHTDTQGSVFRITLAGRGRPDAGRP